MNRNRYNEGSRIDPEASALVARERNDVGGASKSSTDCIGEDVVWQVVDSPPQNILLQKLLPLVELSSLFERSITLSSNPEEEVADDSIQIWWAFNNLARWRRGAASHCDRNPRRCSERYIAKTND
jgi:hypothetical protein